MADQITFRIDPNGMRELLNLALRRVSAFMRFGLDDLDSRDGGDFNLASGIQYHFWPTSITAEGRSSARDEFRGWLVGSCMRELDLFYGLFLDRAWDAIVEGEHAGKLVRSDQVILDSKFRKDTNVSKKHKRVAERIGISDYFEELNSLSLARNALTHHAGVVRSPEDCNDNSRSQLNIKWRAIEVLAQRGGEIRGVEGVFDTRTLPGDGPIALGVRTVHRELLVPAKQQVRLSSEQIAEICMFYRLLGDEVIKGCLSFLGGKGILLQP